MKNKEEKSGVSLFGQSEFLIGSDPIEEIFALNLGDFISEHLISEDLAKKIGSNVKDKKEGLKNQLKELISIYSLKNTLCVLNFDTKEDYAIYTSIAHSICRMLEIEKCNIYLSYEFTKGIDNDNDFRFVFHFKKHLKFGIGRKAGQHARSVVIVEQLAAEFEIQFIPEFIHALAYMFRLH